MKVEANKNIASIGGYAFDAIDKLKNEMIEKGVDIIDFGVGDPTTSTPEFIREAAKKAIDKHKCSGYPPTLGMPAYIEAICKYTKKRFNVELNSKTQVVSNLGSKEAIFNFPLAFLNKGDVVLCPNPGYPPYERGTLFAGGTPYYMNLTEENDFYPDFDKIPGDILKKARIMWMNYPNNPTSQTATKEFYRKAVDFCHKHDIILASDEPYGEIYFEEPSMSLLEVSTEGVVVFNSFSKRSAMTGYRVGWAAGDERVISAFKKLKANVDSGTPYFIQEAAIAALGDETHVEKMRDERKASPISLQVGPTSRCNLNCSFCSNANRTKHEDLHVQDLVALLDSLVDMGLKTVEWTGGGDPTMYEGINEIIKVAGTMGLEQGMITNGILLEDKLTEHSLDLLKWVRVSINSLEYVHEVKLPEIKGTLGLSYVMNEKTSHEVLDCIKQHVEKYNPEYVRVVTNCLATDSEQVRNNEYYPSLVKTWGKPYFYQPKVFERSEKCYWCYLKPFVLHDGFVYPCSSVVLNSGADGRFHEKYRWVRMEDLQDKYEEEMESFSPDNCNHCVFKQQNDLIEMILHPVMENFV